MSKDENTARMIKMLTAMLHLSEQQTSELKEVIGANMDAMPDAIEMYKDMFKAVTNFDRFAHPEDVPGELERRIRVLKIAIYFCGLTVNIFEGMWRDKGGN